MSQHPDSSPPHTDLNGPWRGRDAESLARFRTAGHELVDFIADYWASLQEPAQADRLSVRSAVAPGDILAELPEAAPPRPDAWTDVLSDVQRIIMPGVTHWQHPAFAAYFPANASPAAVLGDLLSAGLGVQGMLWATSPACTELEVRVMDWLARLIDLPPRFMHEPRGHGRPAGAGGGIIMATASESTLVAMVAARHRALTRTPGAGIVVYTSEQAHSSVMKAAMVAGIARRDQPESAADAIGAAWSGVRLIPTGVSGAMRPDALVAAIKHDLAAGRTPAMISATVGTTGTMGVDDLDAIGEIAQTCGAWLHVDAAYAGSACVCPEHQWMLKGPRGDAMRRVDSLCFNPHKWLLTNFDCGALYVADRTALGDALSITPEYLRNAASDSGKVVDFRDWQIALGRRFRSLKLWFVMRLIGVDGLRAHIREHVRLAERFERLARKDERFEIPTPRALGLVCLRLKGLDGESPATADARNHRLMDRVNAAGKTYITHTLSPRHAGGGGRVILRVAIGGSFTRESDVDRIWSEISRCAGEI